MFLHTLLPVLNNKAGKFSFSQQSNTYSFSENILECWCKKSHYGNMETENHSFNRLCLTYRAYRILKLIFQVFPASRLWNRNYPKQPTIIQNYCSFLGEILYLTSFLHSLIFSASNRRKQTYKNQKYLTLFLQWIQMMPFQRIFI